MTGLGLADSRIPVGLVAAAFDGYVGFPPQRPSPGRRGAGGDSDIR